MMYADLIDQEDLLGQLKSLGLQVPGGVTAEQACEHAVARPSTSNCCRPWPNTSSKDAPDPSCF